MVRILLDDRENARGDYPMGTAEIVVDFCDRQIVSSQRTEDKPCNVKVMDCSSFSNSSVKVSALGCAAELIRDMAIDP